MSLSLITVLPGKMTEDTQDAPAARWRGAAARRFGSMAISLFSPAALPLRCFFFFFYILLGWQVAHQKIAPFSPARCERRRLVSDCELSVAG